MKLKGHERNPAEQTNQEHGAAQPTAALPVAPKAEFVQAEVVPKEQEEHELVPKCRVLLQSSQLTFSKAKQTKQFFFPFDRPAEELPSYVFAQISKNSNFTDVDTVNLWLIRSGKNTDLYAHYPEGTYQVRAWNPRFEGKSGFLYEKAANQNPAVFHQTISGGLIQVKGGSAFLSRKDNRVMSQTQVANIGRFTYSNRGIGFDIEASYMRGTRLTTEFYIHAVGYR